MAARPSAGDRRLGVPLGELQGRGSAGRDEVLDPRAAASANSRSFRGGFAGTVRSIFSGSRTVATAPRSCFAQHQIDDPAAADVNLARVAAVGQHVLIIAAGVLGRRPESASGRRRRSS